MFVAQYYYFYTYYIIFGLVASLSLPGASSFRAVATTPVLPHTLLRPAAVRVIVSSKKTSPSALSYSAAAEAADDDDDDDSNKNSSNNNKKADEILECTAIDEADRLKQQIFQLGASYDRGYGASSQRVRQDMLNIIQDLERCNSETNASIGIEGNSSSSNNNSNSISPLLGAWQMVWTTAVDVLLLQASPLLSPGPIYQVFDPPIVTNIIDFLPRAQSLFPPDMVPNTLLRAKVQTRASPRTGFPNRVGLVFERVQFQPLQLLGQDVQVFPPLQIDLPKLPESFLGSLGGKEDGGDDGPGYFDVTFLDEELLVIRQNAPGGLFVLRKVQSIEA